MWISRCGFAKKKLVSAQIPFDVRYRFP